MKEKYYISVNGCDDSTRFWIYLDEQELEVVKKVIEECNKNIKNGCMPDMKIYTEEEALDEFIGEI